MQESKIEEIHFEHEGRRYGLLFTSGILGQECFCGANAWTVDDPPRILSTEPALDFQDPQREGHLRAVLETTCKDCGAKRGRPMLTTRVERARNR